MQRVRRFRWAVEPLVAFLLVSVWWASESGGFTDAVSLRSDTFSTSPYGVAVAAGFGLSVAVSRLSPAWSVGMTGTLLLAQLLFWPARFSQVSWTAYLFLAVLVFLLGLSAPPVSRWVVIPSLVAGAVVVTALLNFPSLSISGSYGTINGKSWDSIEIVQGAAVWCVVCLALAAGCWRYGRKARRVIEVESNPAPSSELAARTSTELLLAPLSPRERQIFYRVAEGLSNGEIASEEFIAETTVKSHVGSILNKLHASSRSELIALAYRPRVANTQSVTDRSLGN
jgi:DNA-binding CsgD family transcriptional regulator